MSRPAGARVDRDVVHARSRHDGPTASCPKDETRCGLPQMMAVLRRPRCQSARERRPQHRPDKPERRSIDATSWLHLDQVVWQLPEHIWSVKGLNTGRRQVETAALIQSHAIFNDQVSLWNELVIGAIAIEGSLREGWRGGALALLGMNGHL